jgi:energy-coupling factor transporter ATP-binding protein EcfA2
MPEFNAPLVEWALHYAKKGVPIFPCAPKSKIPAISKKNGGNGVDDATTDLDQIRAWWAKYPAANIGAACGHKFDVVDLDGEQGQQTFKDKEKDNKGQIVASTKTPGGGYHVYYEPTLVPLTNGVKRLPGVDLRTKGGYVLLPPSYVIEEEKGYEGHYEWRKDNELNGRPLPNMPRWIQDAFKRAPSSGPSQVVPEIFPDGERNDRLFRFGCGMRRKGSTEFEINATLQAMNECRCVPPLDSQEVRSIAKKCCNYTPEPERKETWKPAWNQERLSPEEYYERRESEWLTLADIQAEEVPWLFERRFAKGMFSLLQGDPGEGKSTIARAMTAMITSGHAPNFWGMNTDGPRDVVWLTKEESLKHSVVPALSKMGANLSRVHVIKMELDEEGRLPPDFIFDDWGIQQLREKIEATQAVLVVIDPLVSFFDSSTDIHRQNETRKTLGRLIQLGEATGAIPLGIVHQNKGNNANAIYRAIGSIDFPAAARTAFMVGHDPDDRGKKAFVQIKSNLGPFASPLGFTIEDDGELLWDEECTLDAERMCEPPNTKARKEKTDACRDWLESQLEFGKWEVATLVQRAKDEGFSQRLVYNCANELRVSRGNQPTIGKGRGPAWWAKKGYDWTNHEWEDPFE